MHHNWNFRNQLTGRNVDEQKLYQLLQKQKPAPALFNSTGARSLKTWLQRHYPRVDLGALTDSDWDFYILTLRGRNILTKTFKRYLGETKKLLRYFGVAHARLNTYRDRQNPLKRTPVLKPKTEYCALEWDQIQKICEKSRSSRRRKNDNILGRAILTLAFTTGARVGSLLPPRYGDRRAKHVPITRANIRLVGAQFHI